MIKTKRQFAFTEKEVKEKCMQESGIGYSDSLCTGLYMITGKQGAGSYQLMLKSKNVNKVIGDVYRVSLDEARKIVNNIKDNLEEFKETKLSFGKHLVYDFRENGYYPRKPMAIDDALGELERLKARHELIKKKLKEIEDLLRDD